MKIKMNINIGDKYIIESNAHDFILYEVRIVQQGKTAGQKTKARIGYFSKLDQLIRELFSRNIKSEDIQSLREMQQSINRLAMGCERAFSELGKGLGAVEREPVLYALRFKNEQGVPDEKINDNCLFSSYDKAKAYGRGGNYVTQPDGKIERVPNPALDPEVVPLYTADQVAVHSSGFNPVHEISV